MKGLGSGGDRVEGSRGSTFEILLCQFDRPVAKTLAASFYLQ